jgi:hypothetical protein
MSGGDGDRSKGAVLTFGGFQLFQIEDIVELAEEWEVSDEP